jgi:uncharacterized protein
MMVPENILLPVLGFTVGTIGTMVGAGGGFILVPALLLLYPMLDPETITGVSLVIVFCNASSGSIAYAYQRTIDYRSALIFAIAAAPGSIIGALVTSHIPRKSFDFLFGMALIGISIYLAISGKKTTESALTARKHPARKLVDRLGRTHIISYNRSLGAGLSVVVGFISSLLGIGGGVIHVPIMVRILKFPVHVAAATSHLVLAISALLGASIHLFKGDLVPAYTQLLWLAPTVIIGAQFGAYLSTKLKESWIIKVLAIGLLSLGVRLLLK